MGGTMVRMDALRNFECKVNRCILRSRYEVANPDYRGWWSRAFKLIEDEAKIPEHQQGEVLQNIFPNKVYKNVLLMLGDEIQSAGGTWSEVTQIDTDSAARTWSSCYPLRYSHTTQSAEHKPGDYQENSREVGKSNPYLRFHNRSAEQAAIWYEKPGLGNEGDYLAYKVASEFVRWLKKLDRWCTNVMRGDVFKSLSVVLATPSMEELSNVAYTKEAQQRKLEQEQQENLEIKNTLEMFDYAIDTHYRHSMQRNMQEISTVSKQIADCRRLPKKDRTCALRRAIKHDLKKARKVQNLVAFGQRLPQELRGTQPSIEAMEKLNKIKTREELATMAVVWEGTERFKSVQNFLKWLPEHSDLKIPDYFVRAQSAGQVRSDHDSDESLDEREELKNRRFTLFVRLGNK